MLVRIPGGMLRSTVCTHTTGMPCASSSERMCSNSSNMRDSSKCRPTTTRSNSSSCIASSASRIVCTNLSLCDDRHSRKRASPSGMLAMRTLRLGDARAIRMRIRNAHAIAAQNDLSLLIRRLSRRVALNRRAIKCADRRVNPAQCDRDVRGAAACRVDR